MKLHVAKLTLLLAAAVSAVGCFKMPGKHNLPPAQMLMHPGPGVDGPGPGVMSTAPAGIVGPMMSPFPPRSSQVHFIGPEGTHVHWDLSMPGAFDSPPLVAPGRSNFPQGAIYRLKLTNIPGRVGVELYPTVEVAPQNPRTEAFLAHNPIPVEFTEEDFAQVATSNYVTKVIFVPDPEFQEMAVPGVRTLVSTRLDPGADPIAEADRRGSILAIVRLGNIDLELPGGGNPAVMDGMILPVGYSAEQPGVVPAGHEYYQHAAMGGPPMHMHGGMVMGGGPIPMAHGHIAGVTMPQYGMPMSGTPIGLPGPPHVPLGIPAGLQKHSIKNHTPMHLPGPTDEIKIGVKQTPGFSYPKPASRAFIHERSFAPGLNFFAPFKSKLQMAPSGPDEYVPVHPGHHH